MQKVNLKRLKAKKALLTLQEFRTRYTSKKNVILYVNNLKTYFPVYGGIFRRQLASLKAVDSINFYLESGKTFGLVGESGCGKTTVGRTIIRIYDVTEGDIYYKYKFNNTEVYINIAKLTKQELRFIKSGIQMIFQDPYSSLNPRFTIGDIIEEPIKIHMKLSNKDIKFKTMDLLEKVGLSPEHYYRYPHEFSGGQRQRIGLARALSTNPEIVIADEPVSALDVSVQAQVINLMQDLQEEFGLTYIFIAHDLSVVKHISHNIGVMYLGELVEISAVEELYNNPKHPYTKVLLKSIPTISSVNSPKTKKTIKGDVPSPINKPYGCSFNTRCSYAQDICFQKRPDLKRINELSSAACHLL